MFAKGGDVCLPILLQKYVQYMYSCSTIMGQKFDTSKPKYMTNISNRSSLRPTKKMYTLC